MEKSFKVGDNVRFLNDTGGGIVRKVLRSSGLIYVEDESGFEIPVLENELIKVEETSATPQKNRPEEPAAPVAVAPKVQPSVKRGSDPSGELLNVALCYLPEEGGTIGQCHYEVYLVNDSNYDLYLVYTSGRGAAQQLRYAGMVPFDSSEMLESFSPDDLPERVQTTMQLLAFKEEGIPYRPKEAMSFKLKIDGPRFFKENAFVETPYFDDKAITFKLVTEDKPLVINKLEAEQLAAEMMKQKVKADRQGSLQKRHQERSRAKMGEPVVVDLHIDELVDSTLGLEPKDMLDIQLRKVEEVIRAHRKPSLKGTKLIFIHGKGEGVLRKAVWNLVQSKFPQHDIQNASFQEYGFGAAQVTIK